jgi:hypothetical protein
MAAAAFIAAQAARLRRTRDADRLRVVGTVLLIQTLKRVNFDQHRLEVSAASQPESSP